MVYYTLIMKLYTRIAMRSVVATSSIYYIIDGYIPPTLNRSGHELCDAGL